MRNIANMLLTKKKKKAEKIAGVSNMFQYIYTYIYLYIHIYIDIYNSYLNLYIIYMHI